MEGDFDQHQVNVTHLMAGPPFCELFDLLEITVGTSLVTIAAMLAFGFVTPYSGLDATLGLGFAHPGVLYPFFGTLRLARRGIEGVRYRLERAGRRVVEGLLGAAGASAPC